jgi:hypothetical protein
MVVLHFPSGDVLCALDAVEEDYLEVEVRWLDSLRWNSTGSLVLVAIVHDRLGWLILNHIGCEFTNGRELLDVIYDALRVCRVPEPGFENWLEHLDIWHLDLEDRSPDEPETHLVAVIDSRIRITDRAPGILDCRHGLFSEMH